MRVHDGDPIEVGEVTVTPRARALPVRLANVAWVWSTPAAVRIERHGRITYQPILDLTGIALLAIVGGAVVMGALAMRWRAERTLT